MSSEPREAPDTDIDPVTIQTKADDENAAVEDVSFFELMWWIFKAGGQVFFTLTNSLTLFALGIIIGHIYSENQEDNLAATALIIAFIQMLAVITISGFYSVSFEGGNELAQLGKLRTVEPNELVKIQQKESYISALFKNGMVMWTLLMPAPVLAMYFSEDILTKIFHQDPHIAALAQSYLRPFGLFVFPLWVLRTLIEQLLLIFKKQSLTMATSVGGWLLGTSLSVYFALVRNWGFRGIVYGNIVDAVVTGLGFSLILGLNNDTRKYNFFGQFKFGRADLRQLRNLAATGASLTITGVSEVVISFLMSMFAGWAKQLPVQDFATQLASMFFLLQLAFGQVGQIRFSEAAGGHHYRLAQRISYATVLTSLATIGPLAITAAVFPDFLMRMITNTSVSPEVIAYAKAIVPMAAINVLFDTVGFTELQMLRAAHDNLRPTIIAAGALWLGVPAAYVLTFVAKWGIVGVAAGYGAGMALRAYGIFGRAAMKLSPEEIKTTQEAYEKAKAEAETRSQIAIPEIEPTSLPLTENEPLLEHSSSSARCC